MNCCTVIKGKRFCNTQNTFFGVKIFSTFMQSQSHHTFIPEFRHDDNSSNLLTATRPGMNDRRDERDIFTYISRIYR